MGWPAARRGRSGAECTAWLPVAALLAAVHNQAFTPHRAMRKGAWGLFTKAAASAVSSSDKACALVNKRCAMRLKRLNNKAKST